MCIYYLLFYFMLRKKIARFLHNTERNHAGSKFTWAESAYIQRVNFMHRSISAGNQNIFSSKLERRHTMTVDTLFLENIDEYVSDENKIVSFSINSVITCTHLSVLVKLAFHVQLSFSLHIRTV